MFKEGEMDSTSHFLIQLAFKRAVILMNGREEGPWRLMERLVAVRADCAIRGREWFGQLRENMLGR